MYVENNIIKLNKISNMSLGSQKMAQLPFFSMLKLMLDAQTAQYHNAP